VFELDLVTHDARKFFGLLLRKNGYVLGAVVIPLGRPRTRHETRGVEAGRRGLRHEATTATTISGFAETQWRLFEKETPRRSQAHCCMCTACS